MPKRLIPFITKDFYHVFNKGNNGMKTFLNNLNYDRFLELVNYYRFDNHSKRFSHYLKLPFNEKYDYINLIKKTNKPLVNIHAFSLMPNHFHFLLEQLEDKGVQIFMSNLINSYTKYFNTKESHYGQIFLTQFKSKLIVDNDLFLHICRYIILNPLTANIVD